LGLPIPARKVLTTSMTRRTELLALARVLTVAALAILVAACNSGGGGGAGGY